MDKDVSWFSIRLDEPAIRPCVDAPRSAAGAAADYRMLPKKAHQFIGGMNLVILQLSIFDRYISI